MAEEQAVLDLTATYLSQKDELILQLLLDAIQLIKTPKESDYLQLKAVLFKQVNQLLPQDAQDLFVALTNHYNWYLIKKPLVYANEGFELYQFADKNNLLLVNGRIRDVEYLNVASVGFYTKHFDWTLNFIERNKTKLAPATRSATYTYVNAIYRFRIKEYAAAIDLLLSINFTVDIPTFIRIQIRSLLLRSFVELWEKEQYPNDPNGFRSNQIVSYRRFIKQQKLSPDKLEGYLSFIEILDQIVKLKGIKPIPSDSIVQLKKQLDITSTVRFRNWF